jgi:hypothetical protein
MKIGILNGGGDCPGLNAVIHGVVGAADQLGWEVIGFRDGFEGLLPPGDYTVLRPQDTIGILKLGGTILGTTNKGHFAAKVGEGEVAEGFARCHRPRPPHHRPARTPRAHRRRRRWHPHHRPPALPRGLADRRRTENHRQRSRRDRHDFRLQQRRGIRRR